MKNIKGRVIGGKWKLYPKATKQSIKVIAEAYNYLP